MSTTTGKSRYLASLGTTGSKSEDMDPSLVPLSNTFSSDFYTVTSNPPPPPPPPPRGKSVSSVASKNSVVSKNSANSKYSNLDPPPPPPPPPNQSTAVGGTKHRPSSKSATVAVNSSSKASVASLSQASSASSMMSSILSNPPPPPPPNNNNNSNYTKTISSSNPKNASQGNTTTITNTTTRPNMGGLSGMKLRDMLERRDERNLESTSEEDDEEEEEDSFSIPEEKPVSSSNQRPSSNSRVEQLKHATKEETHHNDNDDDDDDDDKDDDESSKPQSRSSKNAALLNIHDYTPTTIKPQPSITSTGTASKVSTGTIKSRYLASKQLEQEQQQQATNTTYNPPQSQYNQTDDSPSIQSKESVAERRRKRAIAAAAALSNIDSSSSSSILSSKQQPKPAVGLQDTDTTLKVSSFHQDEDDSEDDGMGGGDGNGEYSDRMAISPQKKKKGFFKVKSLIRRGNKEKEDPSSLTRLESNNNNNNLFKSKILQNKYEGKHSAEVTVDRTKLAEVATKLSKSNAAPSTSSILSSSSKAKKTTLLESTPDNDHDDDDDVSDDEVSEMTNPTFYSMPKHHDEDRFAKSLSTLQERGETPSESENESSLDPSESAKPLMSSQHGISKHALRRGVDEGEEEDDEDDYAEYSNENSGMSVSKSGIFRSATAAQTSSSGRLDRTPTDRFLDSDNKDISFYEDPPLEIGDEQLSFESDEGAGEDRQGNRVENFKKDLAKSRSHYLPSTVRGESNPLSSNISSMKNDRFIMPKQADDDSYANEYTTRGSKLDKRQVGTTRSSLRDEESLGSSRYSSSINRGASRSRNEEGTQLRAVRSSRTLNSSTSNDINKSSKQFLTSSKYLSSYEYSNPKDRISKNPRVKVESDSLQDRYGHMLNKTGFLHSKRNDPRMTASERISYMRSQDSSEVSLMDSVSTASRKSSSIIVKPAGFTAPQGKFYNNAAHIASDILDPIQRAGVRILSAAAVPIQREIRRFLAIRELQDRKWAVIVIQAYLRRWSAELYRFRILYCAARIQAAFRGWLVRDTLEDQHYCATQIQRIARGYLATMYVYESLYNITVVQSIARRNAAIKVARHRLGCVLTIQSAWRGFLYRSELGFYHWQAAKIQAIWRGYSAQLNYQFSLVDIIIVQTIARRRAAIKLLASKIHAKHSAAAIVIQKYWRRYDDSMTYLHTIADILIVQSVARRWLALRELPLRRLNYYDEKATMIQKTIRGWESRMFVKRTVAAINIQRCWRGFQTYVEYIFTIADIVNVQRTVRLYLAKKKFRGMKIEHENNAAIQIQRVWRGYHAHVGMLFTFVQVIIVQSVARRYLVANKFKVMLAKRRKENQAVTKIQALWRGFHARYAYEYELYVRDYSATQIQKTWRRFVLHSLYRIDKYERTAATVIQAQWRGFVQYSHYVITVYETIRIQSFWRSIYYRRRYLEMQKSALKIQTVVRVLLAKRHCQAERLVQAIVTSTVTSQSVRLAATRIERWYIQCHLQHRRKRAALIIERFFIWVRIQLQKELEEMERKDKMKRLMYEKKQKLGKDEAQKFLARERKNGILREKQKRSNIEDDGDEYLLEETWQSTNGSIGKSVRSGHIKHVYDDEYQENSRHSNQKSQGMNRRSIGDKQNFASNRALMNGRVTNEFTRNITPYPPTDTVDMMDHDDDDAQSEVSGVTAPSVFNGSIRATQRKMATQDQLDDDELESAWANTENMKKMNDRKVNNTSNMTPSAFRGANARVNSARALYNRRRDALKR